MKKTRQLQNDLISNTDQPTGNENFTYKKRPFAGPSYQKLSNFLEQQNTDVAEDTNDYYQIIHNSFFNIVTQKLICYLGANFVGISHQGLVKLCGVLNVPPPIDDDHFSRTITHILPVFESYKLNSMKNAIEEACSESNTRKLTVSGDGTWQKRGFSSLHGIVEIMSTGSSTKVLDLERLSKSCSICTGALSIKHSNPTKYEEIKNKHKCEINHSGSSKSMEAEGIYRLFSRCSYVGDGDSKVFPQLTSNPPYKDVSISKIDDVNHFSKKMLHRLQKIAKDLKETEIDGKLGIGGKGRMTQQMMINFQQYYRQAIVRNKTNLDEMIRSVWAIWKHKCSSNEEPHHEWCSIKYCGYLKSLEKDEEYDHNKHRLPLGVMKAIRPVFDELAHPDTLKKVINGGSQNSNESFHAVLWNLAPKTRYATGAVIDLCAAIAVLSFNDGNQSILPVIDELTGGGCGFYTKVVLKRLDERRVYYEHKQKRTKQEKTKLTNETLDLQQGDRMSLGVNDDNSLDDSYIPGAY
ncbi:unnamed protein product [Rotaria sp. Silwood1]|nr:unnamed protein product [Rotaria sp. Silwood1]CAF3780463.1 unnamed protein product [Rotaria sp. Silwood1]CAF4740279.1 unnamed protein product [Rotaria sp. Silwood1]CAF4763667.1 unnamed protein product [Rotaria sp. Silwood1]